VLSANRQRAGEPTDDDPGDDEVKRDQCDVLASSASHEGAIVETEDAVEPMNDHQLQQGPPTRRWRISMSTRRASPGSPRTISLGHFAADPEETHERIVTAANAAAVAG
jgi:hypothetical protein